MAETKKICARKKLLKHIQEKIRIEKEFIESKSQEFTMDFPILRAEVRLEVLNEMITLIESEKCQN